MSTPSGRIDRIVSASVVCGTAVIAHPRAHLLGSPRVDRRDRLERHARPTAQELRDGAPDVLSEGVPARGVDCRLRVVVADERLVHRIADAIDLKLFR